MKEGWKYKSFGDVVIFDKRFKGVPREKQKKVVAFKHVLAETQKNLLTSCGSVKLLATGLFAGYTTEELAGEYLNEGEVITIPSGGNANIKYHKGKFVDSGNILCVAKDDSIYLKYVYYCLLSQNDYIESCFKGTGIHHPFMPDIWEMQIPIPPLSEQERIVSYLDAQFAKIDALKANTEQQLQAAKDLFQSALKEMLTPKEGWEKIKLTKVCESITAGGDAPKGRVRDEKDENFCYPIYSNGVENEGLYGYTDDYKYNKPAITVAARGTIGAAFIRYVPFTPIVRLITLIPDSDKADIGFMYYIIKSLNIGHTGSSIPQLTVPMIKEMEFSFPSLPEQERIAARLDAISEKVKALQANYDQTITLCNDLKQSLLKSIFA